MAAGAATRLLNPLDLIRVRGLIVLRWSLQAMFWPVYPKLQATCYHHAYSIKMIEPAKDGGRRLPVGNATAGSSAPGAFQQELLKPEKGLPSRQCNRYSCLADTFLCHAAENTKRT